MKQLRRKLSAGILELVPPLQFPSVPCSPSAFGKARAERVGVPGGEGPPTKTPEVLGALSHFHPLLLWSKWNVSS